MNEWLEDNMWVEWILLALYSFEIGVWVAGFGLTSPRKTGFNASGNILGWSPDSTRQKAFLDDYWYAERNHDHGLHDNCVPYKRHVYHDYHDQPL